MKNVEYEVKGQMWVDVGRPALSKAEWKAKDQVREQMAEEVEEQVRERVKELIFFQIYYTFNPFSP